MGYRSMFSLEIANGSYEMIDEIWSVMRDICDGQIAEVFERDYTDFDDVRNVIYTVSTGEHKWYDEFTDMGELSEIFPSLIFKVHRIGEDANDITDDYFVNGKGEICRWFPTVPKNPGWMAPFRFLDE